MEKLTTINRPLNDLFDFTVLSARAGRFEEGDVHLWAIDRVTCQNWEKYSEYFLSEEEQKRVQRFRFSRDRDLFIMGRHITRILLAHYAGSTPDKVRIVSDTFGKPFSDVRLHFNISHSHDLLLLGFSDTAIGVDVEKKDSSIEIERLGKNHFAEAEFQRMMVDKETKRRDTFFDIWTKKESFVKGIGNGLHIPLQEFNVASRDGNVRWDLPNGLRYEDWYVRGVETNPGYASAYATQNPTANLSYFRLDS